MKKDNQDAPMTIAKIKAFRNMLDLMEGFIRKPEAKKLKEVRGQSDHQPG